LLASCEDVDARDTRAFTPVFDGLLRGHDGYPRSTPPVRLPTSATILAATASIS
jgi:hypothetical protein